MKASVSTALFQPCHRISMGLRFGHWLSHLNTMIFFSLLHPFRFARVLAITVQLHESILAQLFFPPWLCIPLFSVYPVCLLVRSNMWSVKLLINYKELIGVKAPWVSVIYNQVPSDGWNVSWNQFTVTRTAEIQLRKRRCVRVCV